MLFIEGTTVIEGCVRGQTIQQGSDAKDTTLVVNGQVNIIEDIRVQNVTITGLLRCKTLVVDGVLAVKDGASVFAETIKYGSLVVEPKASLNGTMSHSGAEVEKASV